MKIDLSTLAVPVVPDEKNAELELEKKAKNLVNQGLQPEVPAVSVVPVKNWNVCDARPKDTSPRPVDDFVAAVATGQPPPPSTLPADLVERVDLICQMERWPETDRVEWLDILRGQIERDGVPTRERVETLDALLARQHTGEDEDDTSDAEAFEERASIMEYDGGLSREEAEQRSAEVNDCMSCRHWKGVMTYAEPRFKTPAAAGVAAKPKSMIMGTCARHNRPWRVSNIPSQTDYFCWHFLGECGMETA